MRQRGSGANWRTWSRPRRLGLSATEQYPLLYMEWPQRPHRPQTRTTEGLKLGQGQGTGSARWSQIQSAPCGTEERCDHVHVSNAVSLSPIAQHEPMPKTCDCEVSDVIQISGGLPTQRSTSLGCQYQSLASARTRSEPHVASDFFWNPWVTWSGQASQPDGQL